MVKLTLFLFSIQVLKDGVNDEVVNRTIPFLAQSDQSLDWPLFHLLLWNVDRQFIKDLLLRHVIHLPNKELISFTVFLFSSHRIGVP